QKGPNWPADCRPRPRGRRSDRGPKPPNERGRPRMDRGGEGGLEAPRRQKDPQAQNQR
ncbi:hypothetical protein O181_126815, partial [Austropuccinia psidii MF-1]|nr:hypothetical protein [Austropuccinia psidii MF-1]